jgi:hypothetical protein
MDGSLCTQLDAHAGGELPQWTDIGTFDCEVKSMEIPDTEKQLAIFSSSFSITIRKRRKVGPKGISTQYPFFLPKLTTS